MKLVWKDSREQRHVFKFSLIIILFSTNLKFCCMMYLIRRRILMITFFLASYILMPAIANTLSKLINKKKNNAHKKIIDFWYWTLFIVVSVIEISYLLFLYINQCEYASGELFPIVVLIFYIPYNLVLLIYYLMLKNRNKRIQWKMKENNAGLLIVFCFL